jgi:FkbM family methyltransferase
MVKSGPCPLGGRFWQARASTATPPDFSFPNFLMAADMAHLRATLAVVKTFKNWPTHMLDYLNLLSPRVVQYRLRNGVKFMARAKTLDQMVIREIWIYDEYNPRGFEIARDAIVVDVGGHIGCFAVRAGRMASEGKVFVFEPSPENFAMLKENLLLNGSANVMPLGIALLGQSGIRRISLCPNMVSNSIVADFPDGSNIDVQGIALSDLMKEQNLRQIDFLKLDCEGAEYEILFGCSDDTLARIGKISCEVHALDDDRNRETLATFLRSKGFEVIIDPAKSHMIFARRNLTGPTGQN